MIDYEYLARSLAGLSGVPVRIYREGEEICRNFPAGLPRDPMDLYRKEIVSVTGHVGYYCTPLFHYYGVMNADDITIVAGPTAQIMADEQNLRKLAFEAEVPPEEVPAFVEGMNSIRRIPVETLLQMPQVQFL